MKLFHLQFLKETEDGASHISLKVDNNGVVPEDCTIKERKFTAIMLGYFQKSVAEGKPVSKYFKVSRCPFSMVEGERYVHPVKYVEPYIVENVLRSFTAVKNEPTGPEDQAAIYLDVSDPFIEAHFLNQQKLYRSGKFTSGVYQTKWVNDQTLTSSPTIGIIDKDALYQIVYTDPNTSEKFVSTIHFDGVDMDIKTRAYEERPRKERSFNNNHRENKERHFNHRNESSRMGSFGEALCDAGYKKRDHKHNEGHHRRRRDRFE